MLIRNISKNEVEEVLTAPDKIITEMGEQLIYQKLIEQKFIYRVFVNNSVLPPLIKTVYKTSKISKYL